MFFRDDKKDGKRPVSTPVPLLPLRDIIVFPHMVVPLFVGREKSIAALDEAMGQDRNILLIAQKKAKTNNPLPEDIFQVGTLAHIKELMRLPDGTVKVLMVGQTRARVLRYVPHDKFLLVETNELADAPEPGLEAEALVRSVHATFDTFVRLNKRITPELVVAVGSIEEPSRLSDIIVAQLSLKLNDKQALLEETSALKRLEKLYGLMQGEIEILQVEKKIRSRVKKQMEKTQKEYYLNEQMQAIQKELGERDEFKSELGELEEKIKNKKMSKEATLKVKKEFGKLKMMSPMSAEATVVRNYIDWILDMPWFEYTKDKHDIVEAQKILDADHFGLKKPKERITEYLAVQALVEKMKGPILCFVGPPGVGKTSLGKSIARTLGRKFVRVSLGGVRDEAEIRGHRRTYIGALPGKIVQSMKRAGSGNPVFLLDEIDKMSTDFRGDPSSALLEVLDPEQNIAFVDHYLDLDYDLSKVLFVCTANTLNNVPGPLLDRLEVIRIAGYTDVEKLQIARKYLIAKQKEANGLDELPLTISPKALTELVHRYTREAGVRGLERELASVCRKLAKEVLATGKRDLPIHVNKKKLHKLLGPPRFSYGKTEAKDEIGLVTGLAWTEVGGELLQTEVTVMPGKGKLILTGKLGDVMQESAQAALSYVRSRAEKLGIDKNFHEKFDIHVHVAEGAVPKDGPSAGVTMATAMVSALTRVPVKKDVAMTGEITLRGRVLPIGGLKEKALAAHRGGIKTVIIPRENAKDVREIPMKVRKELTIIPVDHIDEVLALALVLKDPASFFHLPQEQNALAPGAAPA